MPPLSRFFPLTAVGYTAAAISIHISREAIHSTKTYLKIHLRNLPREVLRSFISSYIFKYFDEGMSQKDSRDDSKGPASTQKFNYLYFRFRERRFSASEICILYTPIGVAFDNSEKTDLLLLENNN